VPAPRPAREGGFLPALLGVPVVGVLAANLPLVAAGVTLLLGTAVAAVVSPGAFIAAAAVLSTAIPKAGYVVSGFPVPVMMPVLLAAALLLRWRADPAAPRYGSRLAVVALAWLAYRLVTHRLDGGTVGDALALAGWYGLPIVLLLVGPPLGALRGRDGAGWRSRLETGLLLACGFSLVQQVLWLEQTAVPGVTRAVGTDYATKPLLFPGGTKIPSTYQNGNVLGVITGFFFLVAAERVLGGRGRPRDGLIMAATAVATVLSGSRTVIIGLAIGLAVLVFRSGLNRRTIAVFVLGAAVLVTVLQLSPALADRLIGTTGSDPALAQRTAGWSNVLRTTPVGELLAGGPVWAQQRADPGQAEGLVGAVQQVGVIGMALFVGVFLAATSAPELRRWRLVLIPVAVSFVVDSAYLVFPTMFLPVARMFAPLRPEPEAPAEEPTAAEAVSPVPV
jgi:hypothetical protein